MFVEQALQSALQVTTTTPGTDWVGLGIDVAGLVIALILFYYFIGRGIFVIKENQVGILIRKNFGEKMPQGQVIARNSKQVGIQPYTLTPKLYWRFPLVWSIKRAPITEIKEGEVGLIESIDGQALQKGRLFGDEVESDSFQNAELFYQNGGRKGPQVAVLRPGRYRINVLAFNVEVKPFTTIGPEETGIVTANDGVSLASNLVIAPVPLDTATATAPNARPHNAFQDGQAFIDSMGYRGPQLNTLQPGGYYINTTLFNVQMVPKAEIPPGYVAVLRSNVGEELERAPETPTPVNENPDNADVITHEVETLLTTDKNKRGILRQPISPGKYNLNTIAYTAYLIPTSAIMVDWASSDRPAAPSMSRASATPTKDESAYPYITPDSVKGQGFFQFNQLNVTSKDGFRLEVDVRMVIRVLPENASFVVARFGSVFNLIQQIVHPLIDASFRNYAGEKKALEFVQGRTQLQQESLEKARAEFALYHVEAQNLLISYIQVDENLLATQTNKEIALQQQTQFQEQAKAQEQRVAVEAKTAMANKQPDVIAAQLEITINESKAKALVKQSEGIRDSKKIVADGDASAIRKVGEATADAYHAQSDVLGAQYVAAVKLIDEVATGRVKITPDILLMAGKDGESGAAGMFQAFLATIMQQNQPSNPAGKYVHKENDDYKSALTDTGMGTTAPPVEPVQMQSTQQKKKGSY